MAARTIIAKNNTGSDITLKDLGVTVPASSSLTLTDILTTREITQSQELKTEVTSGDITINDGLNDLSISDGLREIRFETEWEDIEDPDSGWVIRETEPFNPQDGKGWLKPGDNNTLYVFNEDKAKMLSADRVYLTFQKQGTADAEYLKIGNVQSANVGYKPNRNGTIVGATIRITGGYNGKKFFIRDTGNVIEELQLPTANSLVEDLNIDFDSTSLLQVCVCEEGIPREDWYNQNWGYRMKITIDYTKVSGSSNLTNFPVLISIVNANLSKGRSDGYDILFTASDGETKLDHEIESFTQGTGTLVAWVRIPSLSYTANTEIYIYYGYASSTNQQNLTGVWDTNYKAVWHLHNNSFNDSTINAQNGTNNGSTDLASAKIAGGRTFDGTDDYIQTPSNDLQTATSFTISCWFKTDDTAFCRHLIWEGVSTGNGFGNAPGAGYEQEMHISFGRITGSVSESNYLTFFLGDTDDAYGNILMPNYSFSDTINWHHVTAVVTGMGTSPAAELFVDGASRSSDTGDVARTSRTTWDTNLRIGRPGASTRYLDGNIDEVRISTIDRSSGWIITEYNNQNNPSTFYSLSTEENPTTTATVENPLVELEIAWRQ